MKQNEERDNRLAVADRLAAALPAAADEPCQVLAGCALPPPAGKPYEVLLVCILLVVAVAVVFGQTAFFDFVNLDDDQYITNNPAVQQGLSLDGIRWAWTNSLVGNWHPLTTMSLMFDWQFFRMEARGYHIHNVILHAVTTVVLFLMLRRMTGVLWLSALATAIFAIHPLRAESVAWVTERKDVLSGLFFMLTLGAYVLYVAKPSWYRYAVVFVVFALGLMCKAMLVTLPVVMLLLDYWPLGRLQPSANDLGKGKGAKRDETLRRAAWLVVEKIPLFLLALVFSATTAYLSYTVVRAMAILPLGVRLASAPVSCVIYLGQMFWPCNLAANYPSNSAPPAWQVVGACAVLLAISGAVLWGWRKRPYLLFGWLWYLVTILPVIGLVAGGNQLRADRYTYLTQIAITVALVWAVADWSASWPRRRWVLAVVSSLLVIALMAAAAYQTSFWKDSEKLWRHALACTSENGVAHEHLALALVRRTRETDSEQERHEAPALIAEAKEHYLEAIRIAPQSAMALCNLAILLENEGQLDQSIVFLRRALEVHPEMAEIRYNLANVLRNNGNVEEAIKSYEQAIEQSPDFAPPYHNLASILRSQGKVDEAIERYHQAIGANPSFVDAYNNLGLTLDEAGRTEEAVEYYQQALQIRPDYPAAHFNWGNALFRMGRPEEAVGHYEEALRSAPQFTPLYLNLTRALLALGRLKEAIDYGRKTAQTNPNEPVVLLQAAWLMAIHPASEGGDAELAVQLADRACNLTGRRDLSCLDALAVAYASAGRFKEAIATATAAYNLAKSTNQGAMAQEIHMRLQLYRQEKPYREPVAKPASGRH
jgi:tetratricopeptide (TPR) repeat protein